MVALALEILPFSRQYRRDVLRLIDDRATWLHVHLDWHSVDDWINDPNVPIFVAVQARRIVGVMAATPPESGGVWLRLAAIHSEFHLGNALEALWRMLRAKLVALGGREVAILALHPWIAQYLPLLGFRYLEDIVTLRRSSPEVPQPLHTAVRVRHVDWRSAEVATEIDHAAFDPLWRLPYSAIRQAARVAASFTLAELDGRAVGYQMTTLHGDTLHLARLAVRPSLQGSGIGGALLSEMLEAFKQRGVMHGTVNTQATNLRSRRLYMRYGFLPNGYDMPCYYQALTETP
ncbi:MAG: hypothetical protein OHK0023_06840 [Anaerolineae bacterium]